MELLTNTEKAFDMDLMHRASCTYISFYVEAYVKWVHYSHIRNRSCTISVKTTKDVP